MNELYHHGVKGQKWYIRRYQNEDGSLTEAGKKRYAQYKDIAEKRFKNRHDYYAKKADKNASGLTERTVRKAAEASRMNERLDAHAKYILEDQDRVNKFAKRTVRQHATAMVGQISGYSTAGVAIVGTILGGGVGGLAVAAIGAGVGAASSVLNARSKR